MRASTLSARLRTSGPRAKKKDPPPHRPAKKNTRTRIVQAFACGQCNGVHKKAEQADACCRCKRCNTKCAEYQAWRKLCGHCNHRTNLNDAKRSVKQWRERLARAEARLAHELREGRPAKGTAYK